MRFGIGVREITPPFPTPMHGYGGREDCFDEVNDPLTFTAVVLEEGGRRALLGAADLCTFPNDGTTNVLLKELARLLDCPRENILLNASHTHGGPMLPGRSLYLKNLWDHPAPKRYGEWLSEQVKAAAAEAAENTVQGTLWFGEGRTAIPMNRRLKRGGRVELAPNPKGPVDARMQLLVFRKKAGELASVGMRMSCHPVATGAQHRLTADYPGAWRAEFSRAFGPKVIPFFLQGAGGDARPRQTADGARWRKLRHSELPAIGQELLTETLAILTSGNLVPIGPLSLQGKVTVAKTPCERRYAERKQFETLLESEHDYEKLYAEECLKRLDAGEGVPDYAEYQVQTLWLSDSFALIGLDAEPLVGLGRKVESAVAPRQAILLGYTNGCVSYLPDTKELKRGGYETLGHLSGPWTGPLMPGVEQVVAKAVEVPAANNGSKAVGTAEE